jgi:hypothetical protein
MAVNLASLRRQLDEIKEMVGRHVDPSLPDAAATIRCLLADSTGREQLDRISATIQGQDDLGSVLPRRGNLFAAHGKEH